MRFRAAPALPSGTLSPMSSRAAFRLPILTLAVSEQRYSCHGCGNCCRDFTVQLRPDDLRRLGEQGWEAKLGQPVTVEFRGVTYLRQTDEGACIFLQENGLCRIHAEFGYENKPIACQLFPFTIVPGAKDAAMGVNFACASVAASKGATLASHRSELLRMAERVPETIEAPVPTLLADGLVASEREVECVTRGLDAWLRRSDVPLALRLDGLAWFAQSMVAAKLAGVREERFEELVSTLLGALPDELAHLPIDPPSGRQGKLLRQAVFARTEDPKIPALAREGRWRTTLRQLLLSRRFAKGKGVVPKVGSDWPASATFASVGAVLPLAASEEGGAIDDLLTRWLRSTILGRRAWGAGAYGWPIGLGLAALALNAACVAWLAQLRAAGRGAGAVSLDDVRAGLGRVDRMAGRARWLGSPAESMRVQWLAMDDGLRRLLREHFVGTV